MSIRLKAIELRDIVTYKHAEFKFTKPFYVFRGRNLDRKVSKSANAVGKSLLFSALPTLLYSAPPSSDKKNTAKTLHTKGSAIVTRFKRGKDKLVVSQAEKGRSLKLDININGKEQNFREIKEAKKALEVLFPVPEEQFYTFNYLDVMRFNPLLKGSAAQRFAFFESVFDFSGYDAAYNEISERLNSLQSDAALLKRLEQKYDEDKEDAGPIIPKDELEAKEAKLKKLTARHQAGVELVSSISKKIQSIQAFIAVAESFSNFDLRADDKRKEGLLKLINEYKAKIEANNAHIEQIDKYKEYQKEKRVYLKQLKSIKKKLKGLRHVDVAFLEDEQLRKNIANLDDNEEKLAELKADLKKATDTYNETYAKGFSKTPVSDKEIRKATNALAAIKSEYKKLLSVPIDDGKCPSCYQPISREHLAKEKQRLKKQFAVVKKEYLKKREAKAEYDRYQLLRETKDSQKELTEAIASLSAKVKSALKNKAALKEAQEKQKLLEQKRSLSAPKKVELGKLDTLFDYEKIGKGLSERLENLKEELSAVKALSGLSIKFDTMKEAKAAEEKYQKKYNEEIGAVGSLNDDVATLKTEIAVAIASHKSNDKLLNDIKKLKKKTKHVPIYAKLKEAYGSRGVRLFKVQSMAERYIENLNILAKLIFPEKMVFSCTISKGAFGIFAERNNKKPADVRSLSGSESRAFMALSALALAPYLSPDKRFDFIIFDEIESGMDIPTRRLFMEEFLPAMSQAYSLIVCITPMSKDEFFSPHAAEVVIEKKKGVSRIIEGA